MFFSGNLNSGDHISVGEELLTGISELEIKCAAVSSAVSEGYFPLGKALDVYTVNEIEYLAYTFFQKSDTLKNAPKEKQIAEALKMIVSIFSADEKDLGYYGKKTLNEIQLISEEAIR